MVIVDEAHHLRNRTTQAWKFASELQKQFILLLTATPVQNNLEELFNLVTLLEPGLLSTARQFQRHFVDRRDKLTPRNVDELHALLAEVMVRNRRSTVGLAVHPAVGADRERAARRRRAGPLSAMSPRSSATTSARRRPATGEGEGEEERHKDRRRRRLEPDGAGEPADGAGQLEPGGGRDAGARSPSSPGWPASDRDAAGRPGRAGAALSSESTKVDRLLGLVAEFPDKMVIFTQFRATQELLERRLKEAGHDVAVFHGGLSRLEKEAAIERFRGPARLLLCTEAGSEGRNLQFAHAVCNFDLPWNPMKIEQRIGRLSRIGQTQDVHVFNLVAAGTVEAAVLHLLEAKLNMFELVIGEIDMILGNLDDEREFQDVVADLWAESADQDDFARRIDALGERLLEAKRAYLEQRAIDDQLFGNHFARPVAVRPMDDRDR